MITNPASQYATDRNLRARQRLWERQEPGRDRKIRAHLRQLKALGPDVTVSTQLNTLTALLKEVSGPHRPAFMHLVANWTTFIGGLHTSLREYPEADAMFARAEEMADEIEVGILSLHRHELSGLC